MSPVTTTSDIPFTKLQGLGNDFVLVDNRGGAYAVTPELARALADRRLGIGCDQVLVLDAPDSVNALCAYRIFNADGSAAEQCGNGARAIALWLQERGELGGAGWLDSPAGTIAVRSLGQGQIEAELSVPVFDPDLINPDWHGPAPWLLDVGSLGGAVRKIACYGASLGNPHVLVLDDDGSESSLATLGEFINTHPTFPTGANLGLARITDDHTLRLRVFERGVGPTPACGSGAAAAAAMLLHAGKMQNPVSVIQPGGTLVIQWGGNGHRVKMTGPAQHVFHGEFRWNTKN